VSRVIWRKKPDVDGVMWNDLLDPAVRTRRGAIWVLTYREYHNSWHVMWSSTISDQADRLISKNIPEEQLREQLKLQYLLTRGET